MKTPSIFAIAIEALVTVSLIALLELLTALIYALLSFLSAEPTTQSLLPQIPTDVSALFRCWDELHFHLFTIQSS